VPSDQGDGLKISFYAGAVVTGPNCQLSEGAVERAMVDRFPAQAISYQGKLFAAGAPLVAVAEGLGRRRASPGLRRLLNLSQAALDPGDPIAYVQHLKRRPLHYATGESTGASVLMTGSIGDMSVPVAATISAARAAGLVDDHHVDPRYGKTINQVLIDTHTIEGVHTMARHRDAAGVGIHMDVDDLSQGSDLYGTSIPRLNPPLRIGAAHRDARGGYSALLFPYSDPVGMHVFALPGMMTDMARAQCKQQCSSTGGPDPCACDALKPFDIGVFMGNVLSRYLASGGKNLDLSPCNSSDTCPDRKAAPKLRDPKTLH
jgi:hypothetical protein